MKMYSLPQHSTLNQCTYFQYDQKTLFLICILSFSLFQLCVDELLPQIFQTLAKHLEDVLLVLLLCHKLGQLGKIYIGSWQHL